MKKKAASVKTDRSKAKSFVVDLLFWIVGTYLYSFGFVYFLTPNKLAAGGITGLASLVNVLWKVPTGVLVLAANIPLFIAAWKKFGLGFIFRTMIATALNSVFLDTIPLYLPEYHGDLIICALFGGLTTGLGLGMVLRHEATTGGVDILGRLLRLRFQFLSMGTLELMMDIIVVVITGLVYKSIDSMLYSLIVIFVSGRAVDFVIYGTYRSKMLLIVTQKADDIVSEITAKSTRGVTIMPVQGGYTGEKKNMLLCVVRATEVAGIRRMIMKYDDNPFIIIADASEVLGLGFKSHNDTL